MSLNLPPMDSYLPTGSPITPIDSSTLFTTPAFNAVKDLIDQHFPAEGPGCNLVVMHKDQLLASYSTGYANLETKVPMSIESKQHFGSVSKQFTAACVIKLSQEKNSLLKLTDTIRDYIDPLPRFTFQGKAVEITIEDLLRMRSGLPNMQALMFLSGMSDQDASSEQKLGLITSQAEIKLAAIPGTHYHYCNTNYDLLAKIIEAVLRKSGHHCKNIREYADQELLSPCGMDQTAFVDPDSSQPQTIPGYAVENNGRIEKITTRNVTWGPCGIIGTPSDMVKWNGRCPNDIFEALSDLPDQSTAYNQFDYARGLSVGYFDNHHYKVCAHSSKIEGFMTRYVKVEDLTDARKSFAIFIATNSEKFRPEKFDALASDIVNTLAGKSIVPQEVEKPAPKSVVHEGISREESFLRSMNCSIQGWESTAAVVPEKLKNGQWALKFMPNKNDLRGFVFVPEHKESTTFRSIDLPTAQLAFTNEGVVLSDASQSIQGILFKKAENSSQPEYRVEIPNTIARVLETAGSKQEVMQIYSEIPQDMKMNNSIMMEVALGVAAKGAVIKANHLFSLIPLQMEQMDSCFSDMAKAMLEVGKATANLDALNCAYNYFSAVKFGSLSAPSDTQTLIDEVRNCLSDIAFKGEISQRERANELNTCIEIREILANIPVKNEAELKALRESNPNVDRAFKLAEAVQMRVDQEQSIAEGRIVSIDIAGESLPMHVNITGTRKLGDPFVILEAGLGVLSEDWQLVHKLMPKDMQLMSYDRAGTGWSGGTNREASAENALANLEELLKTLQIEPPYVFVGHSYGGFLGQLFAMKYSEKYSEKHSDQVSGLVLVDSAVEGVMPLSEREKEFAFDYIPAAAQNSIFRNDRTHFLDEASGRAVHRVTSKSAHLETFDKEMQAFIPTANLLTKAFESGSLIPCPLRIITAEKENIEGKEVADLPRREKFLEGQKSLATRSKNSVQVMSEKSDHFVMYHDPKIIVDQVCQLRPVKE
jgi:CubicO group peptidase (beta-lactamase class C family)/pimeloyl-ACP methyl ester carboxylesterase